MGYSPLGLKESDTTEQLHSLTGGLVVKSLLAKAGEVALIPGLGRSPAEVKRLLTSVFLPGEFHGQRSLVGYSPLGCKDLDMTEQLNSSTSSSSCNNK